MGTEGCFDYNGQISFGTHESNVKLPRRFLRAQLCLAVVRCHLAAAASLAPLANFDCLMWGEGILVESA